MTKALSSARCWLGSVQHCETTFRLSSSVRSVFRFTFSPTIGTTRATERPSNPALYPDLARHHNNRRLLSTMKRVIDIVGSLLALVAFSPVLALIAVAIKLSSKGPILFKQQRIGQHGKRFTFLKFRSMTVDNDSRVHEEYVKKLIAGQAERRSANGDGEGVFKLTNDHRITRVGAFLRRTSLDEMPQFLNVLWGEMSLVGPRPAIPYEVVAYQTWHRRRVLEVKPGITGLWQVNGRSRVTFDEMVRSRLAVCESLVAVAGHQNPASYTLALCSLAKVPTDPPRVHPQ